MDLITIEGLRLRCVIGCKGEERRDRSDVVVDLAIAADAAAAGDSDDLADAWDYRAAAKAVVEAGCLAYGGGHVHGVRRLAGPSEHAVGHVHVRGYAARQLAGRRGGLQPALRAGDRCDGRIFFALRTPQKGSP